METYNTKSDSPETSTVISNILNRYNLKESEDELVKKFFGKGEELDESNGLTIFWVATKLNDKEKIEKEALSILVERLHVEEKTAEKIIEDIKQDLLPMLKTEIEEGGLSKPSTMPTEPPRRRKQEEKNATVIEKNPKKQYGENTISPKLKTGRSQEKPLKREKVKDIYRESL